MNGYLRRISVCIVLGALTTVAVAWACAAWVRVRGYDEYAAGRTTPSPSGWFIRAYRRPGAHLILGWPLQDILDWGGPGDSPWNTLLSEEFDWLTAFNVPIDPNPPFERTKVINARGWPLTALSCELLIGRTRTRQMIPEIAGGMIWELQVPPYNSTAVEEHVGYVAFPFRPMWTGLVIDVLFYTGLWVAVLSLRRSLSRRIRYVTRRVLLATAAVCVLLGVVSTIGTAWFCACWVDEEYAPDMPEDGYGKSTNGPNYKMWNVLRSREPGALRIHSWWSSHIPGNGSLPDGPVGDFLPYWTDFLSPTDDERIQQVLDARGWPMLSMWGGFEVKVDRVGGRRTTKLGRVTFGIVSPKYYKDQFRSDWSRCIPLAPIWAGFAIDSLFYAALWLVLLFLVLGPTIIQRTIRHVRGSCVSCGYDLRHVLSRSCPECGCRRELVESC